MQEQGRFVKVGLPAVIILALLSVIGYSRANVMPLTARESIENGITQVVDKGHKLKAEQEVMLRIQLAITDFMATEGHAPASLAELVPKYFDSEPKDPRTDQPFPYRVEGKMPKLGAQAEKNGTQQPNAETVPQNSKSGTAEGTMVKGKKEKEEGFLNPNNMVPDSFVYDPTGRRDPFVVFDMSIPVPEAATPIERYSLGQLRLTAVITDLNGELAALVEDVQGHGYTVRVNSKIGNGGGVVALIEKGAIKVVETKKDFTGREVSNTVEMRTNDTGRKNSTDKSK